MTCRDDPEMEPALVQAVLEREWPHAVAPEMRSHVDACESCASAVEVAMLLREDVDRARTLPLPSAGQIWWRAAVRARTEAAHAADRPLTWSHGVAGASAAGLTCAALGLAWPTVRTAASHARSLAYEMQPGAEALADILLPALQWSLPLLLAIATCAVLAPIAIYIALLDD